MAWFFTAVLIAFSAGTVGFACYLVRRLFTTKPAVVDGVDGADGGEVADGLDVADIAAESRS